MSVPDIKIGCCANVFSRMMVFRKEGDVEKGHTHSFDHVTLVASGSVRVTANGKETDFVAPQFIYIKKDVFHKLEALEDNTVCACIHALRDGDNVEDIIAPEFVPEGVDRSKYKPIDISPPPEDFWK